jgi:hypothetical protein
MAEIISVEGFRRALSASGQDFICTREPSDGCAGIRFLGEFQGLELVWDATIMTLAFYNRRRGHDGRPAVHRQFIDIAPSGTPLRRIDIGLELEKIDTTTLLKTIIMVRKYKRLRAGRHEFGGAHR